MSQSTADQLAKGNVIPDVLPQGTNLTHSLVLEWPQTMLDMLGKELDREATQPMPKVVVQDPPTPPGDNYVLIMTDPDLMATNDTNFGQVRHWLVSNVSITSDGELNLPKEHNISPYIGPAPLPNYVQHRPHRYVFILAKPEGSTPVDISYDDLREPQETYKGALEGNQEMQDLKDRWGFNAQKFMERKGLQPVAATYMLVAGTLKSAVDNVTMTAQAGLHKMTEK